MTDTTSMDETQALGVGALISETFSVLGRNFLAVVLIGFVLSTISLLLSGLLNGFEVAIGIQEPDFQSGFSLGIFFVSFLLNFLVYGLATAMIVRLAYDSKLDRPVKPLSYVSSALRVALPVAVLSVVVSLLMGFGLIFLLIPGLWVFGVFYVTPAVVTIEKAGFGGMGRSAALTKNYRWPIVGMFVLLAICLILIGLVATTVAAYVAAAGGVFIALIVTAALNSISYGLMSINTALAYARLREIKEGVSVDEIASVFE